MDMTHWALRSNITAPTDSGARGARNKSLYVQQEPCSDRVVSEMHMSARIPSLQSQLALARIPADCMDALHHQLAIHLERKHPAFLALTVHGQLHVVSIRAQCSAAVARDL
jgi:hypothetical protein